MNKITKHELLRAAANQKNTVHTEPIHPSKNHLKDMDLSGEDLSGMDFSWWDIQGVSFQNACLTHCIFDHACFSKVDFSGARLTGASFVGANLSSCNLNHVNACGVNFYSANLMDAHLDNITIDEDTQYFRMQCPESGYILGYKSCINYRIVTLLIPKDAKRTSATTDACRCEKAKVIEISNIRRTEFYKEAASFVDEHFIYPLGKMVYAKNFNEDRWVESTGGIHFYLSREKAVAYM